MIRFLFIRGGTYTRTVIQFTANVCFLTDVLVWYIIWCQIHNNTISKNILTRVNSLFQAHWGQDFTSQNIQHWNTLLMVNWQNVSIVVNVLLKNSSSLFQSKPKKMSKNSSICKNWMKWMRKNVFSLVISNREIHPTIRCLEEWPPIWKMTVFLWLVLEM